MNEPAATDAAILAWRLTLTDTVLLAAGDPVLLVVLVGAAIYLRMRRKREEPR